MNTCAPASNAARAKAAWVSGQVLIDTASGVVAASAGVVVGEARDAGKLRSDLRPRLDVAAAQADDLETLDRGIGARVRKPHVAEADDENADGLHRHPQAWKRSRAKPALPNT